MHTANTTAKGTAESQSFPHKKSGCTICVYPLPACPDRFGYFITLEDKVIAEPSKTFSNRVRLLRHALGVIEASFNLFGTATIRRVKAPASFLRIELGGLATTGAEMLARAA